ncbi:MAG: hypothetical protein DRQ97_13530 [Gammaproteobacteria bacterium]|nr:MAG: hypothetical protein DRQ97_13530 [Gammaproteobacteria bacterium]
MERFLALKVRYGLEKTKSPWSYRRGFEPMRVGDFLRHADFLFGLRVRWLVSVIPLLLYRRHWITTKDCNNAKKSSKDLEFPSKSLEQSAYVRI